MSEESLGPSELQLQQALRMAIAATDRGDYAGALRAFKAVYDDPRFKAPPDGLSAYGLCVAIEEKQTKKGVDLCRAAIAAQFYDSRHHCNLINLHLKKKNRKAAVEVLEEALGKMPKDAAILAMRDQMGYRRPPPISFLSRDNFMNRILSRGKDGGAAPKRKSGGGLKLGNIHPFFAGLFVLVFFAMIFGGTFYVLYQKAYG